MQLHVLASLVRDKDIPKKSSVYSIYVSPTLQLSINDANGNKEWWFSVLFSLLKVHVFSLYFLWLKFWPLLKKTWHLIEFLVGQKVVDKYQENAEERLFSEGKGAEKLFVLWLFNCKGLDPFCDLTSFHFTFLLFPLFNVVETQNYIQLRLKERDTLRTFWTTVSNFHFHSRKTLSMSSPTTSKMQIFAPFWHLFIDLLRTEKATS